MVSFAPKRILCLIDLSEVSPCVLSWARLLAAHFASQVELFHAAPTRLMLQKEPGQFEFEMLQLELRGQMERLAQTAFEGATRYKAVIVEGHPVQAALERIGADLPDLIVLGSHGYDGMARVLLGSVAENLVRLAPCPLVIVKGEAIAPTQMHLHRVVCPVNLSDFALDCLELASAVAKEMGAELTAVQALEQESSGLYDPEWELHEWIPDEIRERCRLTECVLRGEASEQIVAYLRANPADLVAIGAEQRSFFEYRTLGRTTERVVRYSPASVLLIPRKQ